MLARNIATTEGRKHGPLFGLKEVGVEIAILRLSSADQHTTP